MFKGSCHSHQRSDHSGKTIDHSCSSSVTVRLIPAPRGTSIVAAGVSKKLLQMAGIDDCYTSANGTTATAGNFAMATYLAIAQTYSYLTPDMW